MSENTYNNVPENAEKAMTERIVWVSSDDVVKASEIIQEFPKPRLYQLKHMQQLLEAVGTRPRIEYTTGEEMFKLTQKYGTIYEYAFIVSDESDPTNPESLSPYKLFRAEICELFQISLELWDFNIARFDRNPKTGFTYYVYEEV